MRSSPEQSFCPVAQIWLVAHQGQAAAACFLPLFVPLQPVPEVSRGCEGCGFFYFGTQTDCLQDLGGLLGAQQGTGENQVKLDFEFVQPLGDFSAFTRALFRQRAFLVCIVFFGLGCDTVTDQI